MCRRYASQVCRDFVEADFERCIDAYRIKNDLQSFVEKLQASAIDMPKLPTRESCPHKLCVTCASSEHQLDGPWLWAASVSTHHRGQSERCHAAVHRKPRRRACMQLAWRGVAWRGVAWRGVRPLRRAIAGEGRRVQCVTL
jgi:hypothetical protein